MKTSSFTKSYNGNTVLSLPDLELRPGTIYAILGANGAGKSTMLRILGGLEKADHGNVHEEGITSLGILQLTRRRTGLPLHMQLESACKACQGSGRHLSDRQVEGEIRRAIARRVQSGQQSGYRIRCSRSVQTLIREDPYFESIDPVLETGRDYEIESLPGTGN